MVVADAAGNLSHDPLCAWPHAVEEILCESGFWPGTNYIFDSNLLHQDGTKTTEEKMAAAHLRSLNSKSLQFESLDTVVSQICNVNHTL